MVSGQSAPRSGCCVLRESAVEGARRTVPRDQWQFTADGKSVRMAAGFEPKKIYEVVYRAQDPAVVGVGPAAIRDAISKIKYSGAPELGLPSGAVKRSIAFGISQSGRFLRTFLYYGFNEDESHRKVFDGMMPHVAGGGRGSFNHRFAQPSRDAHPFINFFYPTDIFPFTDAEQTDPVTGVTDGLLTHATKPAFQPNIFYTNSSYEYWGRAASLFHTTIDGTKDARLPANVRGYLMSGGQHGVGAFPPARTIGQQLATLATYLDAAGKWTAIFAFGPKRAASQVLNRYGVTLSPENAERVQKFLTALRARLMLQATHHELRGEAAHAAALLDDDTLARSLADHAAVFTFAEPVGGPGRKLVVKLHHDSQFPGHNIGKFRLALSTSEKPSLGGEGLPENVAAALRTAAGERSAEQEQTLDGHFRQIAPELAPARAEIARLEAERTQFEAALPTSLISMAGPPRTVRLAILTRAPSTYTPPRSSSTRAWRRERPSMPAASARSSRSPWCCGPAVKRTRVGGPDDGGMRDDG